MALKKGVLDSYIKAREVRQPGEVKKYDRSLALDTSTDPKKQPAPQYSHNRVFENPASLKWGTNGEQSGNKQVANGEQSGNKWITNGEPVKSIGIVCSTYLPNNVIQLSHIVGLQKDVLLALFKSCESEGEFRESEKKSNQTKDVSIDYLVRETGGNKGSIKTSINRLKKKGCISIIDAKNGRCGWVMYEIEQELYRQFKQ